MHEKAFELQGVQKTFRQFTLSIDEMSFGRGFVLGLVGRNGAGKSTTIKILMNLIYPDRGRVAVLGMEQPAHEVEIKRRVGYVSENPAFYEDMTVAWLVRLVSSYYPTWDDALYRDYIGRFALDPRKKVKELSKGMKVRLALMLALSHRPEFLILDEPTSGIDPVQRRELLEEIAGIIKDERRTVLLSSHITSDVEQVADYVAIMDDGKIVDYSDKEGMLERWKRVTGTVASARFDPKPFFVSFKREGASLAGTTRDCSRELLDRLRAEGLTDLRTYNVRLDEILLSVAGKEV